MKLRNVEMRVLFTAAGVCLSVGAIAHHPYGMFDTSKEITVSGTVQAVAWPPATDGEKSQ